MSDNKQLKDGLGNLFSIRMRDKSGDGVLMQSLIMASPYPLDYQTGGMYQHTARSNLMAAGLAANAPVYAFRWSPAGLLATVKRFKLRAWVDATAFPATGIARFELFKVSGFTALDTGGQAADLNGNNAKLRTSMATSQALIQFADTGTLTPGTRVVEPAPLDEIVCNIGTVANALITPAQMVTIFEKPQGEHPLLLAQDEGFVLQATIPATGTWKFAAGLEWDELHVF